MSNDPTVLVLGPIIPRRRQGRLFTRRRIVVGAAALAALGALALLLSGDLQPGTAPQAAGAGAPADAAHSRPAPLLKSASRGSNPPSANRSPGGGSSRVADATQAANLFAPRSWHVDPPPPPPPPPMPPAPPTAPPFPYSFIGSYTSGGTTTYFLSRADRVVDAHIGDRLDGVYEFESASANELIFNYTPLNIRQSLSSGANP